jgi:DNA-binding protein H-NS
MSPGLSHLGCNQIVTNGTRGGFASLSPAKALNGPCRNATVGTGRLSLRCAPPLLDLLNKGAGMPSDKSLKVIERKIKDLQAEAAEIRRSEQEGIDRLHEVIEKYRLRPSHLTMAMRSMAAKRVTPVHPKSKVAPKYRSPDNPALVWSGRGLKPVWLVTALNNGRTIEEFLIRDTQDETAEQPSAANEDTRGAPTNPSRNTTH